MPVPSLTFKVGFVQAGRLGHEVGGLGSRQSSAQRQRCRVAAAGLAGSEANVNGQRQLCITAAAHDVCTSCSNASLTVCQMLQFHASELGRR